MNEVEIEKKYLIFIQIIYISSLYPSFFTFLILLDGEQYFSLFLLVYFHA